MHHQGRAKHLATPRTLVFCEAGGLWLFLEGGPSKWFAGRLNGLGGSVEPGEDVAAAAAREVEEECGVRASALRLAAVIHVEAEPHVLLFVYLASLADGMPRPSPEGRLVWHPLAALADPSIPFLPDLRELLPRLAALRPGEPPLSLAARW